MENRMNKSNKGFSMAEVLVVIAIMAIISSMSVGCFYLVRKSTVNGATKDIESMLLRAKNNAQSVDNAETYAEFLIENGKLIGAVGVVKENGDVIVNQREALGSKVSFTIKDNEGSSFTVSQNEGIRFYFDKRSGAVIKIETTRGTTIMSSDSVYGDLSIFIINSTVTKRGHLRLNYANGTVD